MKETLDFFVAGSEVTRYHAVTTLVRETVGHHSHGVAMLAFLINPDISRYVLLAALFHDLSEHRTGDIPSPAKRQFGIGDQVNDLEKRLMLEAGLTIPYMKPEEARTLKLADLAQGAIFCAREISLGNSRMRVVFDRYMSYAHEMNLVGRELELFNLIKEM